MFLRAGGQPSRFGSRNLDLDTERRSRGLLQFRRAMTGQEARLAAAVQDQQEPQVPLSLAAFTAVCVDTTKADSITGKPANTNKMPIIHPHVHLRCAVLSSNITNVTPACDNHSEAECGPDLTVTILPLKAVGRLHSGTSARNYFPACVGDVPEAHRPL